MQKPNLPLIVAVIASGLGLVLSRIPAVSIVVSVIAFGAWFTWSWLEIFEGNRLARRVFGVIVMAILLSCTVATANFLGILHF